MIRTLAVPLFLAFYTSYLPGSVVGKLNPVRAEKPAPTYVGASTVAIYPPPDVTVDTALFPDESHIGYPGPTPSKPPLPRQRYSRMLLTSWTDSSLLFSRIAGDESFVVATAPAYPYKNDIIPLIQPGTLGKQAPIPKPDTNPHPEFNPLRYVGNMSPWYSTSFGLNNVTPLIPAKCALTQVHFVREKIRISLALIRRATLLHSYKRFVSWAVVSPWRSLPDIRFMAFSIRCKSQRRRL